MRGLSHEKIVTHSHGRLRERRRPRTASTTARLSEPLPSPGTSEFPQINNTKSKVGSSQGMLTFAFI